MKKLLLLLALLPSLVFGQTPEQKVRAGISSMTGKSLIQLPPGSISSTFKNLADLSVGRVPALTVAELRAGNADTARIVQIKDGSKVDLFQYVQGSAAVDDSVITYVVGGRRYQRVITDKIRFAWYNQTGLTDHTRLLEKALSTARANKLPLELEAGRTYITDRKLNIYVPIIGNGATIRLKNSANIASGSAILEIQSDSVSFSNFTLDGNRVNNAGTPTNGILGIYANQKRKFSLDNVTIKNTRHVGLLVTNSPFFSFRNSVVDGCGRYGSQASAAQFDRIAVLVDNNFATQASSYYMGKESIIENVKITGAGLDGLVLGVGMKIYGVTANNNGVEFTDFNDGAAGIYVRPPISVQDGVIDGLEIVNCDTHNNTGIGIDIGMSANSTFNPRTVNLLLSGNRSSNNNHFGIGIGSAENALITGNTCWDNGKLAVLPEGGGANSRRAGIGLDVVPTRPFKNVTITNNICYDTRSGASRTQTNGAFVGLNTFAYGSENLIIENNDFSRNISNTVAAPATNSPVITTSMVSVQNNAGVNSFLIVPSNNSLLYVMAGHLNLLPSAPVNVTGIVPSKIGTIVSVENLSGTNSVTLVHSSSFRLNGSTNTVLGANQGARFQYVQEGGGASWRQISNVIYDITSSNVTNWNTSFGWGNHAAAGYATGAALSSGLAGKENVIAAGTTAQYYRGDKSWQPLNATAVGLENVNNTSDADKPISTATQTALSAKANDANVVHLDGTETITGAKTYTGQLTLQNNLTSDADASRSLGISNRRFQAYLSTIYKGVEANGMNFAVNNSASEVFARFHPTTHNLVLQPSGTAGADAGQRLQVQGTSFLNGAVSVGGNITGSGDNTLSLGGVNNRWLLYTGFLYKGVASNSMNFVVSSGADTYARFHQTSHNFLLQAAGNSGTDTGERLQVQGTSLLNGAIKVGGDLTPDADVTRNLGSSSVRFNLGYIGAFMKAFAASSLNFAVANVSADTYARFHPTTHNLVLQAPGAIPTDNGDRLQVVGNLSVNSGSGTNQITLRDATISKAAGSGFSFSSGISVPSFANATNNSSAFFFQNLTAGIQSQATGLAYLHGTYNTINQSGTAGYKGIYMSLYEQANGSGSRDLLDLGTNSAASNGGTHTSRLRLTSAGLATLNGNLVPATTGTGQIGTNSLRWNEMYAQRMFSYVFGVEDVASPVIFRQGSTNTVGGFHGTSGNFYLQASGVGPSDTGERLQVNGTAKATTLVLTNVPVYADNAAATTGGLAVGAIYRTSTGILMIRY